MTLLLALACADPEYGPGAPYYSPPTLHIGNDWLFSPERINHIEVELGPDAWEILEAQRRFSYPRDKVLAQAWIDGELVGPIGVRIRGGIGSFEQIGAKPKLELDLNHVSGERFHGLESLSLNNRAEGCSGMQENLAMAAYAHAGVPASRTGHAQLAVNGQDYGTYVVVESQDDRWLRRSFNDPSGNLYDGKYHLSQFWVHMLDFGDDRDQMFDLEEGQDVGFADVAAISEAVQRSQRTGEMDPALRSLVDWDRMLVQLHVERFIGNGDAFGSGPNNYKVYFEPGRPMVVIPWDTDAAFLKDYPPSGPEEEGDDIRLTDAPGGALPSICFSDADCRQLWEDSQEPVDQALADGTLLALTHQLHSLTREAIAGDPRRPCSQTRVDDEVALIVDYLEDRAQ